MIACIMQVSPIHFLISTIHLVISAIIWWYQQMNLPVWYHQMNWWYQQLFELELWAWMAFLYQVNDTVTNQPHNSGLYNFVNNDKYRLIFSGILYIIAVGCFHWTADPSLTVDLCTYNYCSLHTLLGTTQCTCSGVQAIHKMTHCLLYIAHHDAVL